MGEMIKGAVLFPGTDRILPGPRASLGIVFQSLLHFAHLESSHTHIFRLNLDEWNQLRLKKSTSLSVIITPLVEKVSTTQYTGCPRWIILWLLAAS